ncbi:hypothetical protein BDV40DRAFT_252781 [Aspergillus tamarii]|uniref:Uncharacterized protein n=1 Tax=Aspergillus tamarii TaxID=41984 RepID=A0A5N6V8J2_ASPTM|nr:hypothetical protein BDV40DRAFT_252781 [Aspergillus tamarii]
MISTHLSQNSMSPRVVTQNIQYSCSAELSSNHSGSLHAGPTMLISRRTSQSRNQNLDKTVV